MVVSSHVGSTGTEVALKRWVDRRCHHTVPTSDPAFSIAVRWPDNRHCVGRSRRLHYRGH